MDNGETMSFMSEFRQIELSKGDVYLCLFDVVKFNVGRIKMHQITVPETLKKAVPKRQAEFIAGRTLANVALGKLGFPQTHIPIGKHRSPVWPIGAIGSISHNASFAVACAKFKGNKSAIGIDIETLFTEPQAIEVQALICHKEDFKWFNNSSLSYMELMTLIFSVKESLFKAVYPYVQMYLEFQDAKLVDLNIETSKGCLELMVKNSNNTAMYYEFEYSWVDNNIITFISV